VVVAAVRRDRRFKYTVHPPAWDFLDSVMNRDVRLRGNVVEVVPISVVAEQRSPVRGERVRRAAGYPGLTTSCQGNLMAVALGLGRIVVTSGTQRCSVAVLINEFRITTLRGNAPGRGSAV